MRIISDKRCIIGEGPIWNEKEQKLYYTNGFCNEICMLDIYTGKLTVRQVGMSCAAFCFDRDNRLIVSGKEGVFFLGQDNVITSIYDTKKYQISYGNDMKTGPDGRIYVGTQSEKRNKISDKVDGKLYRIDKNGEVSVLLDGLLLSNGMEWSMDEKRFYHTDSDTNLIREYDFDKINGTIHYTGREIYVPGVDGFTIDTDDNLFVACWGQGHVAVVDTAKMKIRDYIDVPTQAPASCGFAGKKMEYLAIVTATFGLDVEKDLNAGVTFLYKSSAHGRKPYLFQSLPALELNQEGKSVCGEADKGD